MAGRLAKVVVLGAAMVAAVACKKKEEPPPTSVVDAAPAVEEPPAEPKAANADLIKRFPDEKPLANVPAKLGKIATNVRSEPGAGAVIVVLAKGTEVQKVTERGTYVLVNFENPSDATERLEGWVVRDAFNATVVVAPAGDAGKNPMLCPKPQALFSGEQPFCEVLCTKESDCPSGKTCTGQAALMQNGAPASKTSKYCVHVNTGADAGTKPAETKDAGAHAATADAGGGGGGTSGGTTGGGTHVDAGGGAGATAGATTGGGATGGGATGGGATGGSTGGAAPDAGAAGGTPVPLTGKSKDGKCAGQYSLFSPSDKMCRISCAKDADCPQAGKAAFCVSRPEGKACSSVKPGT